MTVEVEDDGIPQCMDPMWAARALRQALCGLAFNADVRDLILEKGSAEMLESLDAIIEMTHDLCTYDPPIIEEDHESELSSDGPTTPNQERPAPVEVRPAGTSGSQTT